MNKKTITGKLMIALLSAGLIFTGCGDSGGDDTVVPTPTPTKKPGNPTPQFTGATAVWAAVVVSQVSPGPIPIPVELSVATGGHFGSTTSSYLDCGAVTVNGNSMTKNSNKSYLWNGTSNIWTGSNPQADWVIAGAGTVPALSYTTFKGFPIVAEISSASTISKSSDHTITLAQNVSNSDSIIVVMAVGSKSITKVFDGLSQNNNWVITSAEMSGMSGSGIIQVAPYNYENPASGQENPYFINEKVVMQNVKVQ